MIIGKEENLKNHIDNKTTIYYYIVNEEKVVKVTYDRDLLGARKDWIKSNDKDKKNELNEEQDSYEIITNKDVNNKHDKTYRSILDSKKDAAYIINQVLNLEEKIKEEEIEKYNSSFVTNNLQNKEADIVYKMKEKDIFFLIEHQNKVDHSMPYRIEEYRIEIIKSAIDIEKIKSKGYEMPEVIPIVIYTGKGNWNAKLHLHSIQDERFKDVNLQKYNLIDINKYEKETLINSDYLIDKMFLIEKAKTGEEAEEAIKSTKDKEDRQKLVRIIQRTLKGKIPKEKLEEIIQKEKGEDKIMEEALDRIITYEKIRARKEERKNILKNIINNMLKKGLGMDEIMELTGATQREIMQVKNN